MAKVLENHSNHAAHEDHESGHASQPNRWCHPSLPKLPVELVSDFCTAEITWQDMVPFWEAYRQWLEARGFRLYGFHPCGYSKQWWPPARSCAHSSLPFGQRYTDDTLMTEEWNCHFKVAPAQDCLGRDVVIKLVNRDTHEYVINQLLLSSNELFCGEWQGVLPPVAILDTMHSFSFLVMPTWSDRHDLETIETVSQVMSFMHCILKGLTFLHERGIVHRDINDPNIMINLYAFGSNESGMSIPERLCIFRRQTATQYCLLDFNQSLKFPEGTSVRHCRIPISGMYVSGTPYRPPDARFGEYQYNPFAYDVACVGNLFRLYFLGTINEVPLLVPLMDKMTTHIKTDRFSAREALQFVEGLISEMSLETLQREIVADMDWDLWIAEDINAYWSRLSPTFSAEWAAYRTPSLTRTERLLQAIAGYPMGRRFLKFVRSILQM